MAGELSEQLHGSSPEKVYQLREVLGVAAGESGDEQTAQLVALYTMVGPALEQFLPLDNAAALDALLLGGAEFFLSLRSDDAQPPAYVEDRAAPPIADAELPAGG